MTDDQSQEPADKPRRRKKRKKRKKQPAAVAERPRRDAEGRERPAFLLEFPQDPELEKLMAAFERGDYRQVRREAPRLQERSEDPAVREAAGELLRRLEPDPLARYLLLASVVLLGFLIFWAYQSHGH